MLLWWAVRGSWLVLAGAETRPHASVYFGATGLVVEGPLPAAAQHGLSFLAARNLTSAPAGPSTLQSHKRTSYNSAGEANPRCRNICEHHDAESKRTLTFTKTASGCVPRRPGRRDLGHKQLVLTQNGSLCFGPSLP